MLKYEHCGENKGIIFTFVLVGSGGEISAHTPSNYGHNKLPRKSEKILLKYPPPIQRRKKIRFYRFNRYQSGSEKLEQQ